jgi:uncharacterized iron-regulated protein
MKSIIFAIVFAGITCITHSQNKPAYLLYSDGNQVQWSELVNAAKSSDIVFFGEYHNNPVCHWLQFELTKELFALKDGKIILGAEMFESDNQVIMNEYLSGLIKEKNFTDEARLWGNYKTDYRPLVEFARENKLQFIATNVPRRYAAAVNNGGFEALEVFSEESRKYFPPLPIPYDPELPGYKAMTEMMGMGGGKQGGSTHIVKAQALKDATMAWFILKNFQGGSVFLHFNGAYHSDNREGIVWYVNHYASNAFSGLKLKILTISVEETDDMNTPPSENKADFMIVTPASMTKTH